MGVTESPSHTAPRAELYELLSEYEEGTLAPEQLELGPMPANATPDMKLVAQHMRLLMGLRLAVGDARPLPYSARFAAARFGWRHPERASRAIRQLCASGIIRYAGSLEPKGKPNGTRTYEPPLPLAASTIENESVRVEGLDAPTVQPAGEVEDQTAVGDAEPGGVFRAATAWDTAAALHEMDVTGAQQRNECFDLDAEALSPTWRRRAR
jgi:hypothetical protein